MVSWKLRVLSYVVVVVPTIMMVLALGTLHMNFWIYWLLSLAVGAVLGLMAAKLVSSLPEA